MPENTYGARLGPTRLAATLTHLFTTNRRAQAAGRPATPICIWGTHGLGKTAIVEEYAQANGWGFSYLAPAQMEEMGDMHGLPVLRDGPDGPRTTFAAPEWVPTRPGPGILLLDDLNRADDRILRGIMQLLQTGGMFSWKLPPEWQIVATANPDSGDYSVTTMDDAMLTRFLHVTLSFEARAWAAWALASGVDRRGIDFVLSYPEVVNSRRTTPRSLTQFFEQIRDVPATDQELLYTLGLSALEEATVTAFLAFLKNAGAQLPDATEILDAPDPAETDRRMAALAGGPGERRMDLLGAVCTRLVITVTSKGYVPGARHGTNLVRFILGSWLPNDLRFAMHRELVAVPRTAELIRDPALARLMLSLM